MENFRVTHQLFKNIIGGQCKIFEDCNASLAQLVEHALRKRMVVGSIPTGGSCQLGNIQQVRHTWMNLFWGDSQLLRN